MSILIKGVEMPQNCLECPICRHDSLDGVQAEQCNVTLHQVDWESAERPEDCPLEEISPRALAIIEADKAFIIPCTLYEQMKRAGWIKYEGIRNEDGRTD